MNRNLSGIPFLRISVGFTLIELLVVIAVIGMLSSIILSSLNTARGKGTDAAIKSNLASARAQAALFYDANNNSYVITAGAATDVCSSLGSVVGIKGIFAQVDAARVAGNFGQAINTTITTAGAWNVATCHSTAGGWAAEAPLKASTAGTPVMYCVDSNGATKQTNAALIASDVDC